MKSLVSSVFASLSGADLASSEPRNDRNAKPKQAKRMADKTESVVFGDAIGWLPEWKFGTEFIRCP